jgi:radical SAM-linked protein
MQPDALPPPSLPPPEALTFDKVRFRFRKGSALRLLSHHDLLRTFERLLRRADLPVRRTRGFHPHPRLIFALSLPLGVLGHEEVAELELDAFLPAEDIHARLARQAPPGLEILSLRRVDPRASAQVRRLTYRLCVPADRWAGLQDIVSEVLAAPACFVERDKPERRRVDIRPFLSELRLVDGALDMTLWLTNAGTARPAEVLRVLHLEDLLAEGAVLERTLLELHDEVLTAGEPVAGRPGFTPRPITCRPFGASPCTSPEGAAGNRPGCEPRTGEPGA